MPKWLAVRLLGNDMTPGQQQFLVDGLVPDGARLRVERVRGAVAPDVPKAWILTTRDRTNSPARQRKAIEVLGGVNAVVEIDAGHDAMISAPQALADILLDIARTHPAEASRRAP